MQKIINTTPVPGGKLQDSVQHAEHYKDKTIDFSFGICFCYFDFHLSMFQGLTEPANIRLRSP